MWHDRLREIEHAAQIDVLDAVPVLRDDVPDLHGLGDAGIVDENVDLAESLEHLGHCTFTVGFVRDVAGEAKVLLAEFSSRPGRAGAVEIEDRDARALGSERLCGGEADATRTGSSGNDRGFARQKHIPSENLVSIGAEYG